VKKLSKPPAAKKIPETPLPMDALLRTNDVLAITGLIPPNNRVLRVGTTSPKGGGTPTPTVSIDSRDDLGNFKPTAQVAIRPNMVFVTKPATD